MCLTEEHIQAVLFLELKQLFKGPSEEKHPDSIRDCPNLNGPQKNLFGEEAAIVERIWAWKKIWIQIPDQASTSYVSELEIYLSFST